MVCYSMLSWLDYSGTNNCANYSTDNMTSTGCQKKSFNILINPLSTRHNLQFISRSHGFYELFFFGKVPFLDSQSWDGSTKVVTNYCSLMLQSLLQVVLEWVKRVPKHLLLTTVFGAQGLCFNKLRRWSSEVLGCSGYM